MIKQNIALVLFLWITLTALHAQQSIVVAGGDFKTEAGSVSFSIGQLSYGDVTNSNTVLLSEGVQQAYKLFGNHLRKKKQLFTIKLYPNPTPDFVSLEIEGLNLDNVQYMIMDAKHNQLQKGFVNKKVTQISLSGYSSALYLIHLLKDGKMVGGSTVIKY